MVKYCCGVGFTGVRQTSRNGQDRSYKATREPLPTDGVPGPITMVKYCCGVGAAYFYPAVYGKRPRNGQDRSLQSTREPHPLQMGFTGAENSLDRFETLP